MRTFERARSSTSAVIVDNGGERLIIGERDHAMSMDSSWLPLERIAGAAAVLSDLRWVEATRDAFREARARGVPTLLDADLGGGGLLTEFLCLADYAIFSAPALDEFAPGMDERAQLESVLAQGVAPRRRHPRGRRVHVAVKKRCIRSSTRFCRPRSSIRRVQETLFTAPTPGPWRKGGRRRIARASPPRSPPSNAASWARAPACRRGPNSTNSSPRVWIEAKSAAPFAAQGMDGGAVASLNVPDAKGAPGRWSGNRVTVRPIRDGPMSEARETTGEAKAVAHNDMANAIRALAMDAVQAAKSGHPGMPMGMADVATVLFREAMRFDAADPNWPNRDRFVLSAGHGSMLLYSLLYLTGYPGMEVGELKRFRQLGAKTAGHPEHGHAAGIETTTGPLGQGLANAVGMALSERLLNARLGDDVIDHHTYVIAGDGCLMEGISHEAISLAGHLGLGKLIVLFDDNGISIDGPTSLSVTDDQVARFKASGWNAVAIDGHDPAAISAALAKARADASKPWLIACKTTIGYGAPTKAGKSSTHGEPLGEEEIKGTREKLVWPHAPFDIPEPVLLAWRAVGQRGAKERASWKARVDKAGPAAAAALAEPAGSTRKAAVEKAIAAAKSAALRR